MAVILQLSNSLYRPIKVSARRLYSVGRTVEGPFDTGKNSAALPAKIHVYHKYRTQQRDKGARDIF